MKIGIVSNYQWLKLWDNYGTLLQNYALQIFLRKHGAETFWIRTVGRRLTPMRRIEAAIRFVVYHPVRFLSKQAARLGTLLKQAEEHHPLKAFNELHPRHFTEFFNAHVPHSEIEYTLEDLAEDPPVADVYIIGSDRVWENVSDESFLGFGKPDAKRVAYAVSASWGTRDSEWKKAARKAIRRFDAVGVREAGGILVCREVGRPDAVHVADPTLLLDREDYRSLVRADRKKCPFAGPFVLAYFVNINTARDIPWDDMTSLGLSMHADVKIVPLQGAELAFPESYVYTPSPAEWLDAYDKSACVITNSFHGTCFAIIMRKPFAVFLQEGRTEEENERFLSLLERTGLGDRIFSGGSLADLVHRPIDWEKVREKLDLFVDESKEFLLRALGLQ
jgi:hypothetical protein